MRGHTKRRFGSPPRQRGRRGIKDEVAEANRRVFCLRKKKNLENRLCKEGRCPHPREKKLPMLQKGEVGKEVAL